MKTILILVFCLIAGAGMCSDFSDGYQRGYEDGYIYQPEGGMEPMRPMAPMAPMQKIGERGYNDGYRRGVIEGYEKRQYGEPRGLVSGGLGDIGR